MERLKRFGPVDRSEINLGRKRANYGRADADREDHFSTVKEEGNRYPKEEYKINVDEYSDFDMKRVLKVNNLAVFVWSKIYDYKRRRGIF
jgi:hypothetical protein